MALNPAHPTSFRSRIIEIAGEPNFGTTESFRSSSRISLVIAIIDPFPGIVPGIMAIYTFFMKASKKRAISGPTGRMRRSFEHASKLPRSEAGEGHGSSGGPRQGWPLQQKYKDLHLVKIRWVPVYIN